MFLFDKQLVDLAYVNKPLIDLAYVNKQLIDLPYVNKQLIDLPYYHVNSQHVYLEYVNSQQRFNGQRVKFCSDVDFQFSYHLNQYSRNVHSPNCVR